MRALESVGFVNVRNVGDHHLYRHPQTGVRAVVKDSLKCSGAEWRQIIGRTNRLLEQHNQAAAA
jgi:predicted RNA binding protein YcfA (HicA-like mRNA interferase family)